MHPVLLNLSLLPSLPFSLFLPHSLREFLQWYRPVFLLRPWHADWRYKEDVHRQIWGAYAVFLRGFAVVLATQIPRVGGHGAEKCQAIDIQLWCLWNTSRSTWFWRRGSQEKVSYQGPFFFLYFILLLEASLFTSHLFNLIICRVMRCPSLFVFSWI